MRDLVLGGLRERLDRFGATGDPASITGTDADLELSALMGPNTGLDLEACLVAGLMHWHRYRTAAPGAGSAELSAALRLLGTVHEQDHPDAGEIPAPLRLILAYR